METLEIIITIFIGLVIVYYLIKPILPKYCYTYSTCPRDHDTNARMGFKGKCNKCGSKFK